ncbi:MAG: FlgO family outer membrane protein [Syntrophaceae bacterium]
MARLHKITTLWLTLLCLTGCAAIQTNYSVSLEGGADRIAGAIIQTLPPEYLNVTMLVAAPVDATNLNASRFGLAMQELLTGAMVRHGAHIAEVQLRKLPYISCNQGLVCLSRDAGKLKDEYQAGMILVSSYIVGRHELIITSRVVNFNNNDILASATTTLYRSESINALLQAGDDGRVYER